MRDSISNKLRVLGFRSKLVLITLAFLLLVLEFFVHRHAETDIENIFFSLLYMHLLFAWRLY